MLKSTGGCLCLCLVALVVGILIGGSLEAPVPHNNQIHMQVLPWGKVDVMTQPGDIIDWTTFGDPSPPTIKFDEVPCDSTGINPCTIMQGVGPGIYTYSCTGSASCPDPGVGPITTTGPNPTRFGEFLEKFNTLVLHIARFLDFDEASGFRTEIKSPATPSASQRATGQTSGSTHPQGSLALSTSQPLRISCSDTNGPTIAPPVTGSQGQTIYWYASQNFTLTFDPGTCNETAPEKPSPVQQCTLKASGHYTAKEDTCSTSSASQTITVQ